MTANCSSEIVKNSWSFTGWWVLNILYFHPCKLEMIQFDLCVSNGLRAPTSLRIVSFLHMFAYLGFLFNRPTRSIRWGLLIERVRWW